MVRMGDLMIEGNDQSSGALLSRMTNTGALGSSLYLPPGLNPIGVFIGFDMGPVEVWPPGTCTTIDSRFSVPREHKLESLFLSFQTSSMQETLLQA